MKGGGRGRPRFRGGGGAQCPCRAPPWRRGRAAARSPSSPCPTAKPHVADASPCLFDDVQVYCSVSVSISDASRI